MGRYYSGDIEGKFMFAVQKSDCADRFGVTGQEPAYLEYYFEENDLEKVEAEILNIETSLGDKLQVLKDLFENENGFTQNELDGADITDKEVSDYADLLIGIQIRDCINWNTECSFTAEL